MIGLTPRQRELLDYIRARLAKDGVAPSFEEMREHLGVSSKSGVFQLLRTLEEKGRIRRLPDRARAIEVVGFNPLTAQSAWLVAAEALDRLGAPVTEINVSSVASALSACIQARQA